MTVSADIRWTRHAAATSRRHLALWTAAALVTMSAHAGAAWLALTGDAEPPAEQIAGGAIEIDLAALGFTIADQTSAGSVGVAAEPVEADAVEPTVTTTPAEPVETIAPVQPVETTTAVKPAEQADPVNTVERQTETAAETAARPTATSAAPVDQAEDEPAVSEAPETPPIESGRASEVAIVAMSPTRPVEPEPPHRQTEQAVPSPVDETGPVEETTEVAAVVNVPLPTPRPDYTPAAAPRQTTPAPQQKKTANPPPPKTSGAGGQNQADSRKGAAEGSTNGRAVTQGKQGSSQAGNAAVSSYPGKVRSKLSRAVRRGRDTGEVHVTFVVIRSGGVSSVRVARSSGKPALDQAAVDAVRRAAPFPPIPDGRASWPFTIPLSFNR